MQGYRTYLVASLTAVFGVLAMTDWTGFFNDPKAGAVAVGGGILMAIMRSITSTPPGVK